MVRDGLLDISGEEKLFQQVPEATICGAILDRR